MKVNLMLGDCLEKMKEIPDGSVDLVLTDPPYGTMNGFNGIDWDYTIDNDKMWQEINRVLRVNGCCILFSQEPYTSKLITQGHNNVPFSYRAVWQKDNFANALLCNKAMVSYFEDICVFFKRHDSLALHPLRPYFADVLDFIGKPKSELMQTLGQRIDHCSRVNSTQFELCTEATYNELIERYSINKMQSFKGYADLKIEDDSHKKTVARVFNLHDGKKYKSNILEYKKDYNGYHPTQKPVALLEDLIKTYTNEATRCWTSQWAAARLE
jgi:site-specific DNA-methyltransferase (adenine-specific)